MDPGEPGRPSGLRQVPRAGEGRAHRGGRGPAARDDELDQELEEGHERPRAGDRVPARERGGLISPGAGALIRRLFFSNLELLQMETKAIWLNGKLVAKADATLNFLTPALHYGVAVFEGIRCYATARGPCVFRLRDHIERLFDSARVLGFRELPYTVDQIVDACLETGRANGFEECYIRPLVWLAEGGWNLTVDGGKPYFGIAVWEWKQYLGAEAADRGVRANISSFTRHHPNVMMTKAKIAGNYPNSVLAKTESLRLGFDEAILLDAQGMVAECTGENIFLLRKGTI